MAGYVVELVFTPPGLVPDRPSARIPVESMSPPCAAAPAQLARRGGGPMPRAITCAGHRAGPASAAEHLLHVPDLSLLTVHNRLREMLGLRVLALLDLAAGHVHRPLVMLNHHL